MKFKTGKGEISLVAILGIWSVSALTSLPGLAVSPIMGDLEKIFPRVSELEIQMLTSLPSLLIIPSILLAGKLVERVGYTRMLLVGLMLFLLCGVLYLFASSMSELILVSALLGVGAGMIIPLSTALVSRYFSGEYRTRQFGYVSAISNLTLVIATALTGYLAEISWRLPFTVYLLPIVSLILLPKISKESSTGNDNEEKTTSTRATDGIKTGGLLSIMWYYFLITYIVLIISLNLPFLIESNGYKSNVSGVLISLFFLAIMLPGFFTNRSKELLGRGYRFFSLFIIAVGLVVLLVFHSFAAMVIGCIISGLGYGIAQPLVYDDTVSVAKSASTSLALAWVMVMNYVAIVLTPFILDFVQKIFDVKSQLFPFAFNMIVAFIASAFYLTATKRTSVR